MKRKIAIALAAVVVVAGGLAAVAEKQASAGKVFLLKSGGKIIAELHVLPAANVVVESAGSSSRADYDMRTGTMVASGGTMLKVAVGTNSISARADEIESVPELK